MSINTKTTALLFTALLLMSCASGKLNNSLYQMQPLHQFDTAPLIGVLHTTENKPCPEATITVYTQDNEGETKKRPVSEVQSDINGRFMIPDLRKGRHEIRVTKEGFEDGIILFDFLDMTKVFYIQMISLDTLLDEAEEFLDRRELHRAEDRINRALKIDERSTEALYLHAVYYTLGDDPEKAQETMDRIKEIDPDF